MTTEVYISALMFGFLGSLHCAVMCGPIAMALPNGRSPVNQISYNLGRITTYLLIGGIFGLIGRGIFLAGFQQTLSILAGMLLLLFYFGAKYSGGSNVIARPINKLTSLLRKAIGPYLLSKKWHARYTVGVINGFLPCGLVYMAAVAGISTGSPQGGVSYMLLFGVGTVPMMLGISLSRQLIKSNWRVGLYKLVPLFVVIVSSVFILRGMNLGVPYLSPKLSADSDNAVELCDDSI
ncbi:MAG: sulfite exporter TauE/SafE family protein [Cyclobacteriaceae bacterium]